MFADLQFGHEMFNIHVFRHDSRSVKNPGQAHTRAQT